MQKHSMIVFFGWLLALSSGLGGTPSLAATPDFTVSATSVTMPSSGAGIIPFTLTSVNGYTGTVVVNCPEVNAPIGARVPSCGGPGPAQQYTLAANGVTNGSLTLLPYGDTPPTTADLSHRTGGSDATANLVLAGVLLFGVGVRRRRARWLTLTLFAVGTLASLAGIGGCAGGSFGMTPGIYAYTITASDIKTDASVSTTVNVTVR